MLIERLQSIQNVTLPGDDGVHFVREQAARLEDSRIGMIESRFGSAKPYLDGEGCTLLPGFIDLHIHGADGADVMDATPAALEKMSKFLVRHGVTSFCPTTMTASSEATIAAVQNIANIDQPLPGARMLGVHLEGPFLSPEFPGAQPAAWIRPPDPDEFEALLGTGSPIAMITLAPEVEGAESLINRALSAGVTVVLGHSAATYQETIRAADQGLAQATHTFNAMSGLHHRRPGAVGAILSDDRILAQIIADGVHVHPAVLTVLGRCKGPRGTLLISDSIRAAGLPAGRYDLGGQPVDVADGACRLEDGTLAGSILTLDSGLRRFLDACGWSISRGWPISSLNAARSLGIDDRLGRLRPGFDADLVLLDEKREVVATLVAGRLVYLREDEKGRLMS